MSDIVEMLRTPTGCVPPSEWELKAADEIEKLRRRVAALELIISEDLHPDDCSDDLNRMLVEQIHDMSRV
jgi:hypothetical protein